MASGNVNVIRKIVNGMIGDITQEVIAQMRDNPLPTYMRAIVSEVIFDPRMFDADKLDMLKKRLRNPYSVDAIPMNSIIATRARAQGEVSYEPELCFPFFPSHLMMPVKAGEHVWIFYEQTDVRQEQGYWVCRINERRDVEDANFTHSDRRFFPITRDLTTSEKAGAKAPDEIERFSFPNGLNEPATYTFVAGQDEPNPYDVVHDTSFAALYHHVEPVPRWYPRPGDFALQGSNNSLISLGAKRAGVDDEQMPADTMGDRSGLGTIDLVVGRGQSDTTKPPTATNARKELETDKTILSEVKTEGEPDFATDSARIYVTMKDRVDDLFNVVLFEGGGSGITAQTPLNDSNADTSSITVKADQVRILAREDVKIVVEGSEAGIILARNGDIVLLPSQAGYVKLGGADADRAILCTDQPANQIEGMVNAQPLMTTMGGRIGTLNGGQGAFSTKVLVKG